MLLLQPGFSAIRRISIDCMLSLERRDVDLFNELKTR